ncbi:hypothetical protein L3556_05470 [Candidatus Synechococcus calcipolaris G9]|uniref:Type I restriction enzyme R protein N-terminal domain-containing protein n=1 Tax=Candidatus Synechococcus calcipolaris G9 TaxID=1497997 RepID=A0ABT6EX51_9SYNE|nr:hypothetical protein [Candidatus Synechococcus calcipolaris]MDG2990384.1 hypothetical protein [Candidatus Synechococcus calcipolaris G9]
MTRPAILKPGQSYTFRQYFEMAYEPEDILAEFGYTLERSLLSLPQSTANLDRLNNLRTRIQESLPYISLTSEAARRELLIAPLLLDVVHYTRAQLRLEYPLTVTEQLKGSLDYYLYSVGKLLVIEAKNADLAKGFTQLAVELIALDKWIDNEQPILQGAVSTGDIWQFGILHRDQKKIQQGLTLYRVPDDLESLMRILVKILES